MVQELPEGVSINRYSDGDLEVEFPFETFEVWNCKDCLVSFETLLIGTEGRYQGQIINPNNNNTIVWKSNLPKVREKAVRFLKENLDKKIERHLEGH